MELRLGFEPLNDYLKYELYKGAMKLVQDVMLAKPGEYVMITADTSSDMRVGQCLWPLQLTPLMQCRFW